MLIAQKKKLLNIIWFLQFVKTLWKRSYLYLAVDFHDRNFNIYYHHIEASSDEQTDKNGNLTRLGHVLWWILILLFIYIRLIEKYRSYWEGIDEIYQTSDDYHFVYIFKRVIESFFVCEYCLYFRYIYICKDEQEKKA